MSRGRAARKGRPVFGAAALYAKERASEDALLAGPHFLDGHRRSRLYRAAIITPKSLADEIHLTKTDRFPCSTTPESARGRASRRRAAPLQRLRSEWL